MCLNMARNDLSIVFVDANEDNVKYLFVAFGLFKMEYWRLIDDWFLSIIK
jgi:hypothetical protein